MASLPGGLGRALAAEARALALTRTLLPLLGVTRADEAALRERQAAAEAEAEDASEEEEEEEEEEEA
jgi:hypothetical protein